MKTPEEENNTKSTENNDELFPGYKTMKDLTQDGYNIMKEAIRHSNALPTGRNWNFYKTSNSFIKIMNDESNNILHLMNTIMRCNELDSNIKNRILDDKTELVIEANDIILEKVANNIDEMNGLKKSTAEPIVLQTVSAQLPINGSWNRLNSVSVNTTTNMSQSQTGMKTNSIKLITAKNIIRPQKFFKDKIDNSREFPWQPRITEKPNSLKPLAIFLEEYENRQEFSHPYEFELDKFKPLDEHIKRETPEVPKPIAETPLIEIDKPEQLDELVEDLRQCKEFAVDVEHHSYRSFMGITCLLQISTGDKDYLIDTLALRDKLSILNEVFTKPTIVKIFHSASSDIEWLQRDLSIYVVNMFDTYQAAKILDYSALSLAFLMRKFCNVIPNKEFQLADWRIRPLSDELKLYAREDTHYLIYIYKMLKNELYQKLHGDDKLVRLVFDRSTEICKKRYFKPILTEDSHMDLYRRCKKLFDNRQLFALKELYCWRDEKAREQDESVAYVLPNHMLIQISETLPREMQGILACCSPIPPLVKSHLLELHHIILKARDQPIEKAVLKEDNRARGVNKQVSKINIDNPLYCPHDLGSNTEYPDNLPTLINNTDISNNIKNLSNSILFIENLKSTYSILNSIDKEEEVIKQKTSKVNKLSYLSPYQRYLLVKPFVLAEEEENNTEKDKNEGDKQDDATKTNKLETNDNNDDDRTVEDRIASVREHFLKISKEFNEKQIAKQKLEEEREKQRQLEQQQSLLQLGGTKKRKREDSVGNEQSTKESPYVVDSAFPEKFYTPEPLVQNLNKKSNNRKRKSNEPVPPTGTPNKKKKRNRNKWKQQQDQQQQHHQQEQQQQQQQGSSSEQVQNQQVQKQKQQNNNKKRNNKRQNQRQQNRGPPQQNQEFQPYDYSSVDFRQFQGGAATVDTGLNMKPKFKPKNWRNNGKRGAKSATFTDNRRHGGNRQFNVNRRH